MNNIERKYIYYPLIKGKSLTYFTFINDIISVWTETKNELDQRFI